MAQRLRTLVAAVNGSNQALEPYRDIRRMGRRFSRLRPFFGRPRVCPGRGASMGG